MSHICVEKYSQRGGGLVQRVQKGHRVVVAPCGRNIKKTFTTGLSTGENRQTALRAREKRSPLPASWDFPRKRWQNKARETTIS